MPSTWILVIYVIAQSIVGLYIAILLVRLILRWFGGLFYNPLLRYLLILTDPILKPIKRIIPVWRNIDFSIILIVIILQCISLAGLIWLRYAKWAVWYALIPLAILLLIDQTITILFYALLLRALLSWIGMTLANPFYEILVVMTEPMLKPFRRSLPAWGGFDWSPLIVGFILKAAAIVILTPVIVWVQRFAIGI